MTQNNNLSVLPFYTDINQQNHRLSYAFGAIYPLIAPANILLPFQIMRQHREKIDVGVELRFENRYYGYYISANGMQQCESGFDVAIYDIKGLNVYSITFEYFSNATRVYDDAVIALVEDKDGNRTSFASDETTFTGTWEVPQNAVRLYIQIKATGTENDFVVTSKYIQPIQSVELYDKNGSFVENITQYMQDIGLQVVGFEKLGYDIIVYPANLPMPTKMFDGIYYLSLSDGVQIWYSEMFTIVQDVKPCLKIEWWDIENFVFDSGQIVYQKPAFKNRLYLNVELGKPDYQFNEEGDNRDGYFFPEKQISEKTYKFTTLAPEYLCDVMRFIRMADYVIVTDKYGRIYNVDTFLITPKWQTQGDLASVEVEFETNTVAKKIGKGYIDRKRGDFNDDYNNDFNNQ